MNTDNPLKILDDFLEVFMKHSENGYKASITSFKDLTNWDKFPDHEVNMVLEKLIKDGYVRPVDHKSPETVVESYIVKKYQLTFEGRFFILNGGYEEASKSSGAEKRLQLDFQVHAKKNAKRLNRLTFWLAVGSITLALVELVKYYFCK